jgi:hypothetical protein
MTNGKKPDPARKHSLDEPYVHGDPIPAPDATETDTDTSWALWSDLEATDKVRYADTVPLTLPGPSTKLPAPSAPKRSRSDSHARVTLEDALMECRRNNRVCPTPPKWQQLYQLLAAKAHEGGRSPPPEPLTGEAWLNTPALAKRMSFRDHIEWAAAHGCIDEVFGFVKRLPEDHWHHMGE